MAKLFASLNTYSSERHISANISIKTNLYDGDRNNPIEVAEVLFFIDEDGNSKLRIGIRTDVKFDVIPF